jgi:rubredoxin
MPRKRHKSRSLFDCYFDAGSPQQDHLDSKPVSSNFEREHVMSSLANSALPIQNRGARPEARLTDLPHNNPCAQCGRPIAFPDWVERSAGRVAYLWQCSACDYRFEAVAFFATDEGTAIAA